MKDLVVEILKIVAPVSVALIVFAQGLSIAPGRVRLYFMERPKLMVRSLIAVLVLVPAAALALILLLKPAPAVAIGLAILVACPPAPLMFKTTPTMGGGSATFMAGLHLNFAVLAFVTVPLVVYLLSIPLGFHAEVDLGTMAWILARTILIPIGLGMAVRAFLPAFADRAGPVLAKAGMVGLVVVVLFALAAQYPALLKMDLWSYLVIAVVSAATLAIGHLLGPDNPHERTTLAVECGVRHPVLAITIASANFSPQKALPVLVPCVITFIAIAMIYLAVRGRSPVAGKPDTGARQ
jgi:BASS family bile acid:Na+ symporter